MRKKKNKLKKAAGQRCASMAQGATRRNTQMSKVVKHDKSKRVNTRTLQHTHGIHQEGNNNAVVQNKENKVSSLQRSPHQRESTVQHQGGKLACLSREPPGQTWHHLYVWDQFNQSTHQLRYGSPADIQCSNIRIERSQTDTLVRRPHDTQRGATNTPEQATWPAISQHDRYNKQYESGTDFTSDQLPQNGAIIFDRGQNESTDQEGLHCSAPSASANRSSNAATIQDVDVSAMLRQIRRALGVREPCRADREARRQNSKAGVQLADQTGAEKGQPAGGSYRNYAKEAALHITSAATTSVQSSQVISPAHAAHSGVCPSSIAPTKPNTTVRMTQGNTQHWEKSSVAASDSGGPSNSREGEFQGTLDSEAPFSQCSGRTASSEPNLNIIRKIRIAHEPGIVHGDKEAGLKPTLNKLFSLSGPKSKLSWREMYEEMKRKKQKSGEGLPR